MDQIDKCDSSIQEDERSKIEEIVLTTEEKLPPALDIVAEIGPTQMPDIDPLPTQVPLVLPKEKVNQEVKKEAEKIDDKQSKIVKIEPLKIPDVPKVQITSGTPVVSLP